MWLRPEEWVASQAAAQTEACQRCSTGATLDEHCDILSSYTFRTTSDSNQLVLEDDVILWCFTYFIDNLCLVCLMSLLCSICVCCCVFSCWRSLPAYWPTLPTKRWSVLPFAWVCLSILHHSVWQLYNFSVLIFVDESLMLFFFFPFISLTLTFLHYVSLTCLPSI